MVEAKGAATRLPARPLTSVTPPRATSASLSPITSKIHGTRYGMSSGADRPRVTGLLPASPMSSEPAIMAVFTSPPESNLLQVILVFGSALSSHCWSLTIRSPLGMSW
ncbi:hypothetical protein GCM10009525_76130 [Streptosporangium amethystogenes subsp. fukuiense]